MLLSTLLLGLVAAATARPVAQLPSTYILSVTASGFAEALYFLCICLLGACGPTDSLFPPYQ
jgi:hypothetical protein